MRRQVESFKNKVGEMAGFLGGPKNTTDYLGKCFFQVGLGSNDYLNNYFIPSIYQTSKLLNPEQYADDLIKQYTTHLMVNISPLFSFILFFNRCLCSSDLIRCTGDIRSGSKKVCADWSKPGWVQPKCTVTEHQSGWYLYEGIQ